jgi:hypothetical protein
VFLVFNPKIITKSNFNGFSPKVSSKN